MVIENVDFDFVEFATDVLRVVDSIRSSGQQGAGKKVESRINAFYRGIGIPAVIEVSPEDEKDKPKSRKLNPLNNGNLVPISYVKDGQTSQKELINKLKQREQASQREISFDEVDRFLDLNDSSIIDGIDGETGGSDSSSTSSGNKRLSGSLLPIIVNGDIQIYPNSKRVAGAFETSQRKVQPLGRRSARYHVPLIETIIIMKLRSAGATNTQSEGAVSGFLSEEFSELDAQIKVAHLSGLQSAASSIKNAILKAGEVRTKIGSNMFPTVFNIPKQNPDIQPSATKKGTIDKQSAEIELRERVAAARVKLIGWDDTSFAGTKRNLKDAFLASQVIMDVTSIVKGATEKNKREVAQAQAEVEAKAKRVYSTLDLALGTFSGLSGIDVLIVVTALYKLDIDHLLGLLNKEAVDRLKETFTHTINPKSTSASLKELETVVKILFGELEDQIKKQQIKDENV